MGPADPAGQYTVRFPHASGGVDATQKKPARQDAEHVPVAPLPGIVVPAGHVRPAAQAHVRGTPVAPAHEYPTGHVDHATAVLDAVGQ